MSGGKFVLLACSVAIVLAVFFGLPGSNLMKGAESGGSSGSFDSYGHNSAHALVQNASEVSSGWTVTSYQDANEAVYDGIKTEVFDSDGKSLGFYKADFLEQVKIDGSGKGDSIQNPGKYLHYDYNVDDGKTYYLGDKSIGAYGTELVSWTGERPSIAINPPLPPGTRIRFKDLGPDAQYNPAWVNELLLNKAFYSDDQFSGVSGKRIDVYVGLQTVRDPVGTPESLWMQNVAVSIEPPNTTLPNPPNPPQPNNTVPSATIPNAAAPNTTMPGAASICQYASSAVATSQNAGSEMIYATGAPDAPYSGKCNIWSGRGYGWNPGNWNVKANITLSYNKIVNVSNFTIYGDYDMCWNMMWLKNSATGETRRVFKGFDKNCTSVHKPDRSWANFKADIVIIQTCGWSWSATDAVQLCGTI